MTSETAVEVYPLQVRLRDRIELARSYLSNPPFGGFAVSAPDHIRTGQPVRLEIHVASERVHESLRGMVIWIRDQETAQPVAGVALFETEVEARERLLNSVKPRFPSSKERREDRVVVSLTASYQTAARFAVEEVRNISSGGIFIRSIEAPEQGSDIDVRIYPSQVEDSIDLTGEVAWSESGRGFGIRLKEPDMTERRRFDQLVKRFEEKTPSKE